MTITNNDEYEFQNKFAVFAIMANSDIFQF